MWRKREREREGWYIKERRKETESEQRRRKKKQRQMGKTRAVGEKKKLKENHMSGHRLDNISCPSTVYGY